MEQQASQSQRVVEQLTGWHGKGLAELASIIEYDFRLDGIRFGTVESQGRIISGGLNQIQLANVLRRAESELSRNDTHKSSYNERPHWELAALEAVRVMAGRDFKPLSNVLDTRIDTLREEITWAYTIGPKPREIRVRHNVVTPTSTPYIRSAIRLSQAMVNTQEFLSSVASVVYAVAKRPQLILPQLALAACSLLGVKTQPTNIPTAEQPISSPTAIELDVESPTAVPNFSQGSQRQNNGEFPGRPPGLGGVEGGTQPVPYNDAIREDLNAIGWGVVYSPPDPVSPDQFNAISFENSGICFLPAPDHLVSTDPSALQEDLLVSDQWGVANYGINDVLTTQVATIADLGAFDPAQYDCAMGYALENNSDGISPGLLFILIFDKDTHEIVARKQVGFAPEVVLRYEQQGDNVTLFADDQEVAWEVLTTEVIPPPITREQLANVNWETDFGTPLSQEEFAEFYEWLLTRPNKPTFFRDTEPIEILPPGSESGSTGVDIRVEHGVNFFPQYLRAVEGEHGTQHLLLAFVVTQVDGVNVLKLGAFSVDWSDVEYNLKLLKLISESKKMQIVILTQDDNAATSKNPVKKDVTGSNPARDNLEKGIFDPGPVPLFITRVAQIW